MKTLFTAAAFACLPILATAQQPCGPRDDVRAYLAAEFGETRHMVMLSSRAVIIEVWGNVETGSWTITATGPDNVSCLLDEGIMFELVADALPPQGEEM